MSSNQVNITSNSDKDKKKKTTLDAGDYVLVLSTFDPHNSPFELVLYASQGAARLEGLVG